MGFDQHLLKNHIDEVDDEQNDTIYEPPDIDVFAQGIMQSKAVTDDVARQDLEDQIPYPELFDRYERTFAATFAK